MNNKIRRLVALLGAVITLSSPFGVRIVKAEGITSERAITTKKPAKNSGIYDISDLAKLELNKIELAATDSMNGAGITFIRIPQKERSEYIPLFFVITNRKVYSGTMKYVFSEDGVNYKGEKKGNTVEITLTSGDYNGCKVDIPTYFWEYFTNKKISQQLLDSGVVKTKGKSRTVTAPELLYILREYFKYEPFIDEEVEVDKEKEVYSKSIGILESEGIRIPIYIDGNIIRDFADEEIGRVRTEYSDPKKPALFVDLPEHNNEGYKLSPLPKKITDTNIPGSINELGEMLLDGGHIDYIVKEEQEITSRGIIEEETIAFEEIDGISYIYKA